MSQDVEGNHLHSMEDVHYHMEDFIVKRFTQSCSKNRESDLTCCILPQIVAKNRGGRHGI